MSAEEDRGPYVESVIIMTTVRVVVPFVLTLGLFVMFHGADSAGGGFQGGVIVAASVLMLAFAFGVEPTASWLRDSVIRGLMALGVAGFAAIGLGALALGGDFLEYPEYGVADASKLGIEAVELGIGAIVAGSIVGLFFLLARGQSTTEDELPAEDGVTEE